MTVREFDGTDDVIVLNPGTTDTMPIGPVTIAAIIKPTTASRGGVFFTAPSANESWGLFWDGADADQIYCLLNPEFFEDGSLTPDEW